jgi:hypothetical protein
MKDGIERIKEERERQISKEGYDKEHDEKNEKYNNLVFAAASYIMAEFDGDLAEKLWPWDMYYYKPKNYLRNLERAGALIAAEIDRITAESEK